MKERRENILILLTKGMKGYASSKYLWKPGAVGSNFWESIKIANKATSPKVTN